DARVCVQRVRSGENPPVGAGAGAQGGRAPDPGKSAGLLRTPGGPVVVYRYIRAQKAADPEAKISLMRQVLGVSRSASYAWLPRVQGLPGGRAAVDAGLVEQIGQIHA